jgi:two-component system LytT family response regulator
VKLRTVIVDDEPLARQLLALQLANHPDIEIVSECKNGKEAIAYVQSMPVDLLFLDVQMTKLSGFDVVNQIGLRHLPPTVFVTAYHEHAVNAFDVNAVDYLTKPVDPERLALALQRVQEKIAAKAALLTQEQFSAVLTGMRTSAGEARQYPARFLVRDGEKEILLPVDKITWVEAAAYYCCLHSGGHGYMVRESISDLSEKLDPRQFVRIHRSSIVNLSFVKEIYREGLSDSSIVLRDGQRLKMSKAGRQKLVEISAS